MLRHPCSRPSVRCSAFVAAVLLLAPAMRAQSKETLGTRLSSAGDVLSFVWDPKHPWAAQMSSSGVQLFAEYVIRQQGRVIEKLDTARPAAATLHEVALHLPGTLQGVPQGGVCLFLQVSGGKRIPLRRPSASEPDTDHFALPAWSAAVSGNAALHSHQGKLEALRAAVSAAQTGIAAQERTVAEKGWASEASCNDVRVPAGAFVSPERPRDVLPAEQHQGAAELECVRRALYPRNRLIEALRHGTLRDPSDIAFVLLDPPSYSMLIQYLHEQKGVDSANLSLREAQYLAYKAAWQRWAAPAREQSARNVTPSYGRIDDDLEVQDVTALVGYEILDFSNPAAPTLKPTPRPNVRDVAGYLGGGLETYTRCVTDGQKELAAKLKAWNEQVARAPMLEGMAKSQLRTQCLNSFAGLAKAKEQLATLEQQLAAEQASQPAAIQTVASPTSASLNFAACTVP